MKRLIACIEIDRPPVAHAIRQNLRYAAGWQTRDMPHHRHSSENGGGPMVRGMTDAFPTFYGGRAMERPGSICRAGLFGSKIALEVSLW